MKKSLFHQALYLARSKLPTHPELKCFPHYTFVVQGNAIVAWATNVKLEPPRHYGYHRNDNVTFQPKYHSEIWAYKRARGLLTSEHWEIINIRLSRAGELRLSRPCKPCHELMAALGCRRYFYSSEVGFLEV